jgi:hypothetical protein
MKKNYKLNKTNGHASVFGSHGTVCCVVHMVKFTEISVSKAPTTKGAVYRGGEGDIRLQGRKPEGSRPRQLAPALLVAE